MQPVKNARVIHFPAKSDKFEFDETVAPIFPDMATRSIPNYHEAHAMHASMLAAHFLHDDCTILDIGASRAGFYHHLFRELEKLSCFIPTGMRYTATDISPSMCRLMQEDYPQIDVRVSDISSLEFLNDTEKFDVINCTYVLQFIPAPDQIRVLRKICSMVKLGGVLLLGQKEAVPGILGSLMHDVYIDFRLNNGYTIGEISAKTEALKNSMWPMRHEVLMAELKHQGFREIVETTRVGVFSTVMCSK